METPYVYSTLANGLRLVMTHRPGAEVDHCGVAVNVGSRDEESGHDGLAHFVEHTIFKGTSRRRAWHILNRMEAVGGELNAYTTKEETMVYTSAPAGNLSRSLDLVADLVADSVFPAAEIDRERQVVADEIDTYLDMPSEGIFDDFDELIFRGSAMAHPILGNRESLERLTTGVCRRWLERRYTPGRMVLFYSGAVEPQAFERMAARYFSTLTRPDVPLDRTVPAVLDKFQSVKQIQSHQAHTLLGCRIGGIADPDRFAMALLTNILGGPGMNSLLNVNLRERRGLVYSIDASTSRMTDCGLFTIYFGCDPEDVDRCLRLVNQTIANLADKQLSERQLTAAKRQYLGQLTVASTSAEQMALNMARATLHVGHAMPQSQVRELIQGVTAHEIRTLAEGLDLSRLTLT